MIAIGMERGISQQSRERRKEFLRLLQGTAKITNELLSNIRVGMLQAMKGVLSMAVHQSIGTIVMVQIAWWGWHGARWLLLSQSMQKPVHEGETVEGPRYTGDLQQSNRPIRCGSATVSNDVDALRDHSRQRVEGRARLPALGTPWGRG
jgi:hypothetical protein